MGASIARIRTSTVAAARRCRHKHDRPRPRPTTSSMHARTHTLLTHNLHNTHIPDPQLNSHKIKHNFRNAFDWWGDALGVSLMSLDARWPNSTSCARVCVVDVYTRAFYATSSLPSRRRRRRLVSSRALTYAPTRVYMCVCSNAWYAHAHTATNTAVRDCMCECVPLE